MVTEVLLVPDKTTIAVLLSLTCGVSVLPMGNIDLAWFFVQGVNEKKIGRNK